MEPVATGHVNRDSQATSLKLGILLPVAAAAMITVTLFVATQNATHRQSIKEHAERIAQRATLEWNELLKSEARLLGLELSHLAEDRQLADLFAHRSRDALLARAKPRFERLHRKLDITHFYFVEPDRTCFLRVHHPPRRGDVIGRHTMRAAEQQGEDAWGIELGPLGTFTLRYVHPWIRNGELIGYLELGKEIEPLAAQLAEHINCDVATILDKRYTTLQAFEAGREAIGLSGTWDAWPDAVVLNQTMTPLPKDVQQRLAAGLLDDTADMFEARIENHVYACRVIPIQDAADQNVARLLIMSDVTRQIASGRWVTLTALGVGAMIAAALLAVLWFALCQTERRVSHMLARQIEEQEQRKRSEAHLADALRQQEAILETSLVGVMVLENRILTKVNRRMAEMLGYEPEELIGKGPQQVHLSMHNFHEFGEKYYWKLAEQDIVQIEYPLRHKSGRTVWCQFNGRAIAPPDLARGAVWIIDDVTERREAAARHEQLLERLQHTNQELAEATNRATAMAARAEQANVSKSEFLANMSHEIRTPMTAILGYLSLIDDECPRQCEFGCERLGRYIEVITRNGNHLLQIINDILDISKIEAGKLDVEHIPCSARQIIADVQSLMSVRSDEKGLELAVAYDGPIPETIVSDPTRIKQILVNLVGNAIKFTEEGQVRLVTRYLTPDPNDPEAPAEPQLCFEVTDTGIGMSRPQLARLFEAFSQADTSMTRKFGGTGLGLLISRRLAGMLGGDITVESCLGQGSTFRVTVAAPPCDGTELQGCPDEDIHLGPAPDLSDPCDAADTALTGRILLAEDGPDNQRLISHILTQAGAQVTVASEGEQAVQAVIEDPQRSEPFDAILMDMQMPVLDGYEATIRLRNEGYTGPIIALTAHASTSDRQRSLAAGCDDHLTKPVNRRELLSTLVALMRAPSTPGEASRSAGTDS